MSITSKLTFDLGVWIWSCCDNALDWMVVRHKLAKNWHVECICKDANHLIADSETERCESEQAAIARCLELNGK